MRLALVHDDFIQWGGAERVVAEFAQMFPDAPIFTSMTIPSVIEKMKVNPARFRTGWINKLPYKETLNKPLFPLYPAIFESFDLSEYEVVISSSTRFAHSVITRPETTHIAYIHSPFRGFWEPDLYYGGSKSSKRLRTILSPILSHMRQWDYAAGQRGDHLVANSTTSQKRIQKYYRREAEVIFPFVSFERFDAEKKPSFQVPDEYYVAISRLVPWKRFDLVVQAFNQLNKHVLIIGSGPSYESLKQNASSKVEVLGFVPDEEVAYLIKHARGLIHPQKEDFGMTVVEANYCETPVIAYKSGGALDTVIAGETGIFFEEQTTESLIQAVEKFESMSFNRETLKAQAKKFGKYVFISKWHERLQRIN